MKKMPMVAATAAVLLCLGGCRDTRDDQITQEVRRELARAQVPGSVDVVTTRRVVTLSGTVPDRATQAAAVDLARRVTDVDRVVDNLRTLTAADAPPARGDVLQPQELPNTAPRAVP